MLPFRVVSRHPDANNRKSRFAILSARKLSQLIMKSPGRLSLIKKHACIVVAIEDEDPHRVLNAAKIADGLVFTQFNLRHLQAILDLAERKYWVMPPSLVPIILSGRIRKELLRDLSSRETRVLALLGLGCSNRRISQHIDLDEARTKYIIRSILKKLHFENRTQAAVFAAREMPALSNFGDRSGRNGNSR